MSTITMPTQSAITVSPVPMSAETMIITVAVDVSICIAAVPIVTVEAKWVTIIPRVTIRIVGVWIAIMVIISIIGIISIAAAKCGATPNHHNHHKYYRYEDFLIHTIDLPSELPPFSWRVPFIVFSLI